MEYGFVNSPYPIVLSIENHCSWEQQRIMAKIMIDVFKDSLALPMKSADPNFQLPSPHELQRKILIKGKREDAREEEEEEGEYEDEEVEADDVYEEDPRASLSKGKSVALVVETKKKKAKASKVHPDLSAITFLGTDKVKEFSPQVSASIPADMMCSYSENVTNKNMRKAEKVQGWIMHNQKHLRCVCYRAALPT